MRTNLPVTQNEVKLTDSHLIVSKTDLKGRITYVNHDFLEISGFTEQELIGEPHNIVRHPDMPVEAFDDLWRTLKEGRPWTGYVKNRCKNGDFYWVLANAAPIVENGLVTGYMSVRRKPDPAVVAQVEAVYRRFREKRQGSLQIRYGAAVKPNPLAGITDISVGTKLWASIGVVVLMGALAAGSAWMGLRSVVSEFQHFADRDIVLQNNYGEMYTQGLQSAAALRAIMLNPQDKQAIKNLQQAHEDFNRQLAQARSIAGEDAAVNEDLARVGEASSKHFAMQNEVARIAIDGDADKARALQTTEEIAMWRKYKDVMLKGRAVLQEKAAVTRQLVAESSTNATRIALLAGLLSLFVAGITAVILGRSIRRPMEEMDETFANILQGNYSNVIDIARNDEIGKAMQGLQILQTRMGFEVAETKRQADEMTRVKIALDCVGTPVRIADARGTVIYANKALFDTLRRIEPVLKAQNPAFSVDGFVGSSIGNLYADPQAALGRLASLTGTTQTEMDIGGRTYRVVTSPVFTGDGERLGSVGEWQDRTDELAVEREVAEIVDNAARGNLDRRINLAGKSGFFAALSERINGLLGTTHEALMATSEVLGRVARGDLTQQIDKDYEGIFGRLKDDTNTTVERLREVVGRIKEATEAINTAAQEIAAGNQDLSSRTEEQASSLEETASSMEQLNATVKQNAESARQANALATRSNEVAARGGEMVKQVVATMSGIQASSKKIADIVGVIDSIAFQTNILALNAAVEAARAGEQGRGFAVVATEVRNLAQRSATAAKEIKALIAESVDKVEGGAQLVNEAGTTMDEVVTSFQQVARLVVDISNASREQSGGIEQVTQAVSQMDEVTQQNAALVEQAAAAAESLEEQAHGLVQAVGMFKLEAGAANLPGPALRDATPRRLAASRPGVKLPAPGRKVAPPHLVNEEDEWEEF
ncbi:MAG: methyl-accepting chemotaxis protein [Rhodocyclaceae bacterium]|jgi:methyl-accepting chemotaxis protein